MSLQSSQPSYAPWLSASLDHDDLARLLRLILDATDSLPARRQPPPTTADSHLELRWFARLSALLEALLVVLQARRDAMYRSGDEAAFERAIDAVAARLPLVRLATDAVCQRCSTMAASSWQQRVLSSLVALVHEFPRVCELSSITTLQLLELAVDWASLARVPAATADVPESAATPTMTMPASSDAVVTSWRSVDAMLSELRAILAHACGSDQALLLHMLGCLFGVLRRAPEEREPSLAVALVFECTPEPLIAAAANHVTDPTTAHTDAELLVAIARVLQLPQSSVVAMWSCALLNSLAVHERYTLLATIAVQCAPSLMLQLLTANDAIRLGALSVLELTLLGYQHTPLAFHAVLDLVPRVLHRLALDLAQATSTSPQSPSSSLSALADSATIAQLYDIYQEYECLKQQQQQQPPVPSNQQQPTAEPPATAASPQSTPSAPAPQQQPSSAAVVITKELEALASTKPAIVLQRLIRLVHLMIFRHSGYPELYDPVLATIEELGSKHALVAHWAQRPSELAMNEALLSANWKQSLMALPRSITDQRCSVRSGARSVVGLVNLGNTCYLNSFLQALNACAPFRAAVFRSTSRPGHSGPRVLEQLQRLFAYLQLSQRQAVAPRRLLKVLPRVYQQGDQHDATEFGRQLLDWIEGEAQLLAVPSDAPVAASAAGEASSSSTNEAPAATTQKPINIVREAFGGMVASRVTCLHCKAVSSVHEPMIDLSVALQPPSGSTEAALRGTGAAGSSPVALEQLLTAGTFGIEHLSGENQYHCSRCGQLRDAEKQLSLSQAPAHLMLTLSYFAWDASGRRSKLRTQVVYPLLLTVPVSTAAGGDDDGGAARVEEHTYSLYAVIVHSGSSMDFGHYYTYARGSEFATLDRSLAASREHWFRFNDSTVTSAEFESLSQISRRYPGDVPYILCYRRVLPESDSDSRALESPLPEMIPAALVAEVQSDNVRLVTDESARARRPQRSFVARLASLGQEGDAAASSHSKRYEPRFDRDGAGGAGGGFAGFGPNRFIM